MKQVIDNILILCNRGFANERSVYPLIGETMYNAAWDMAHSANPEGKCERTRVQPYKTATPEDRKAARDKMREAARHFDMEPLAMNAQHKAAPVLMRALAEWRVLPARWYRDEYLVPEAVLVNNVGLYQAKYRMNNGYGASVLIGRYDRYVRECELAVLHEGRLCYQTHITEDVERFGTLKELEAMLDHTARLTENVYCSHGKRWHEE